MAMSVSACTSLQEKETTPFDCSSKPKCPRFYGTHLTAQAVPQEAPTRVRAKGFTSIWIFLCCWVGLSWRLGLLNPQEKNNLTSWLMSRSVGERWEPNSVEIAKGRRGGRSGHITMATAQITQRMVYRQKEMPDAPPPLNPDALALLANVPFPGQLMGVAFFFAQRTESSADWENMTEQGLDLSVCCCCCSTQEELEDMEKWGTVLALPVSY